MKHEIKFTQWKQILQLQICKYFIFNILYELIMHGNDILWKRYQSKQKYYELRKCWCIMLIKLISH